MEISIIGLGLMGGSMGLALKKTTHAPKIYGYDSNSSHLNEALKLGLVDEVVSLEDALQKEIIILATPVDVCIQILSDFTAKNDSQTIIDLGSTKEKISSSINPKIRQNFVAAHPMTGTEYSGPTAAKEGLYVGCTVVLCDLGKSGEYQTQTAKSIFTSLGAKIIEMDSKTHDLHAAYISHLPHIISFSLANAVLSKENTHDILSMAAGGFRDMSRLAKSRPDLWTQIFRQNRTNLLESIDIFEKNLQELKKAVKEENWDELKEKLEKANQLHLIFR
ncbi:MAG: prephenate dehydrogenase [Campylobacterales bacterium]